MSFYFFETWFKISTPSRPLLTPPRVRVALHTPHSNSSRETERFVHAWPCTVLPFFQSFRVYLSNQSCFLSSFPSRSFLFLDFKFSVLFLPTVISIHHPSSGPLPLVPLPYPHPSVRPARTQQSSRINPKRGPVVGIPGPHFTSSTHTHTHTLSFPKIACPTRVRACVCVN